MKKLHTQSAFTLIETLVAIAILMVAITGPLTIANKGLVAAVGSRDQTIASYLAQDLMEYVKNVRDDNIQASPARGWLTYLTNISGSNNCTPSTPCIAETADDNLADNPNNPTSIKTTACNFSSASIHLDSSCLLYVKSGTQSYYTYSSAGNQPTQFYRAFTLAQLTSTSDLLTVSVYWTNGTILNQVILQSVIFNAQR
jgi:prepilin-type N-terminal cleavage/methylation domain-containing protein